MSARHNVNENDMDPTLWQEESRDSHSSETEPSVAQLMAVLESEDVDTIDDSTTVGTVTLPPTDAEVEPQAVTASGSVGDNTTPVGTVAQPPTDKKMAKLPDDIWTNMSTAQRKNYLRSNRPCGQAQPTSDPTRKRGRDLNTTASPNERKKPKVDFRAAVSGVKIAVTHSDYPHSSLKEETVNSLLSQLLTDMRSMGPTEGCVGFYGRSFREGALVLTCKDELSKDWFSAGITRLSPWDGVPLKCCDPKELEGFRKIGTFIPKPVHGPNECMHNIKLQNPGLQTERWRVLGYKDQERGAYLVASVPESNIKALETTGLRIFHGFDTINVRIFSKKEERTQVEKEQGEERVSDGGRVVAPKPQGTAGPSGSEASKGLEKKSQRAPSQSGSSVTGRRKDASGPVTETPTTPLGTNPQGTSKRPSKP